MSRPGRIGELSRARVGSGPYRGKRVVDVALLTMGSVPALAVGAVCAAAIRLDSPGPALFTQVRVGKDGREFVAFKFRTMIDAPNPEFPDPSRITRVGRSLRRTSLDELPQLFNVLRGEMSVVGPRPTLPYQVERYDAAQRGRLLVKPGITGLAQVNGRNSLTWSERITWDLKYVREQSMGLDLRILARTVLPVLVGTGVEGHPTEDPLAIVIGDPRD